VNIQENIRIAAYSIRTNLMRSLLTMLGIIIGVCSVIAIITVGDGGKDYIIKMLEDLNSSVVTIRVSSRTKADYVNKDDIERIKAIKEVKYVSPVGYGIGSCASDYEVADIALAITGNVDLQYVMNMTVLDGRFFNEEEFDSSAKVCLIPDIGAAALFGSTDCLGEYVTFNLNNQSVNLKIIGITSASLASGSSSSSMMGGTSLSPTDEAAVALIVPSTVTDQMQGLQGAYDTVYIMAEDPKLTDTVGNVAANILYSRHNNFGSEAYTVTNMASYIDLFDSVVSILTTFIAGVSGISLVVGGIGVMNIMLVSVTERTREIGIRKALGAKTRTILYQFLTESIILCMIGGLVGLLIGVIGAYAIANYMDIPISLKFSTVALALGFSSAIGIFFGIYPARRAAKMQPIEALRRD